MITRWGSCFLKKHWCHLPNPESQKKGLVWRKGERNLLDTTLTWDNHVSVWECSRNATSEMSLVKKRARLEWKKEERESVCD